MNSPSVQIGPHLLGADHPPVFWPDIDVYFKREVSQALYLIDKVVEAGGQFLKGAVLHRENLCLRSEHQVSYYNTSTGTMVSESYKNVIERHVVPIEVLGKIMRHAADAGLSLVLSVYDAEGLAFAQHVGAVAVKLPSSNITHKALIEAVAASRLPLIMDTGRSKFSEIERAVGWVRHQGAGSRLLLQHSPPGPPAPAARFHLRMIQTLAQVFSCPVGLSDHHPGLNMVPLAVALGACVIEKGLVVDEAVADLDVAHALPAGRLREALSMIEDSWRALGECQRPDEEVPDQWVDRMCIIAGRDIAAGEIIAREMLDFAFPPLGIGAEHLDAVVGAVAREGIAHGMPVRSEVIGCQGRD